MDFKFIVGQPVEYQSAGGYLGLFTVIRQMPVEFRNVDRTYRIKSELEGFERSVPECELSASDKPGSSYRALFKPRHGSTPK